MSTTEQPWSVHYGSSFRPILLSRGPQVVLVFYPDVGIISRTNHMGFQATFVFVPSELYRLHFEGLPMDICTSNARKLSIETFSCFTVLQTVPGLRNPPQSVDIITNTRLEESSPSTGLQGAFLDTSTVCGSWGSTVPLILCISESQTFLCRVRFCIGRFFPFSAFR